MEDLPPLILSMCLFISHLDIYIYILKEANTRCEVDIHSHLWQSGCLLCDDTIAIHIYIYTYVYSEHPNHTDLGQSSEAGPAEMLLVVAIYWGCSQMSRNGFA